MSSNSIISQIEAEQMDKEVPEFGPGDTVMAASAEWVLTTDPATAG